MKRFLGRTPRAVSKGTPLTRRAERGAAPSALEIEELEPRLTPDYWGSSSGSGGSGTPPPPDRTVGWGC